MSLYLSLDVFEIETTSFLYLVIYYGLVAYIYIDQKVVLIILSKTKSEIY